LYSGNTNIQGSGRLGGGNFTGNITVGSTLTFHGTNNQTISGSISGASLIYKYGNATLTLRGSNTMTGDIQMGHSSSNITAGTIRLEHVNALGSKFLSWENDGTIELGVNGITITGGALIGARNSATDGKRRYRLDLAGSNTGTISGNFDIRMNGVTFDVGVDDILTLSGNMNNGNGAASWEKTGAGTLVLTGATNTAVGITTISGGTVQVGNGGTTGTLNSISNVVNNGTLVFNRSDTITVANQISGNGSVVQSGSGTLILSGSNTYSGITVINSGTLEAAHANALGTNNTVQVSGGTLLVSANGALNGKDIELNSNTVGLSFNGSYSGTVGSLTLCADSIIDLGSGTIRLLIEDLDLSTYTLSLFNWTGTVSGTGDDTDRIYVGPDLSDEALSKIYFYSGDYGTDSFLGSGFNLGLRQTSWEPGLEGYQIIAVPEPETWATALLLLAVGGFWMCRKINDPS
jgi:autotransporter-associated beta strand protein